MANWIRWWNYASFWKLFGAAFGAVILCLLCGLFIPTPWCLIPIAVFCLAGRFLIKKVFPDVLDDLVKEFDLADDIQENNEEEKAE